MKIQLIEEDFDAKDAIEIVTKMIHVKIKYQEGKINESPNEKEVNLREYCIKNLQKKLYEIRKYIENKDGKITIQSSITL